MRSPFIPGIHLSSFRMQFVAILDLTIPFISLSILRLKQENINPQSPPSLHGRRTRCA
jgi:hypothetical protein